MHMAIGILAALQQRHRTGRGQHVEVSMQDAVTNLLRVSVRDHQRLGGVQPRTGNQLGRTVPGSTYPCAPGGSNDYVFIFVQAQMWPAFVEVLDNDELRNDPRFATLEARWENRDMLNPLIEGWTRQRTKHEVMRLLGAAGVPCGACQDTGEVLADPHLKARDMVVDIDYPGRSGTFQTIGCPVKLSDSPAEVTRRRPWASIPASCWRNCATSPRRSSPACRNKAWCKGRPARGAAPPCLRRLPPHAPSGRFPAVVRRAAAAIGSPQRALRRCSQRGIPGSPPASRAFALQSSPRLLRGGPLEPFLEILTGGVPLLVDICHRLAIPGHVSTGNSRR